MKSVFAILLASMTLAACDPSGSGPVAPTATPVATAPTTIETATSPTGRQDLVNECIFQGGQMYACECRATAAMEKAPKPLLASMIAGAKASEPFGVTLEMASDPTAQEFVQAYALCALQDYDEIIRQQCIDSGAGDDSLCACRVNTLQRELGGEMIRDLAREIRQHPDYAAGDTPGWWNDEERAKYAASVASGASCVSSR